MPKAGPAKTLKAAGTGEKVNGHRKFLVGYHVVCLLDVLGQKDRLAGWSELPIEGGLTETDLQALKKTAGVVLGLQSAFERYFEEVGRCTMPKRYAGLDDRERERYHRFRESHLSIQQFSDTFVFYAPIPNDHGDVSLIPLHRMIGACCVAMLASLAAGTPVRGALAIGAGMELAKGNFYGPALAEAHCLESEVAQYPRVVVSPHVHEFLKTVQGSASGGWVAERMRSSMLGIDRDGHRIVDYMGESVYRPLSSSLVSSQTVRLAFEFACAEADRFRAENNQKLAERYNSLRCYMESRMGIWGSPVAE